MYEKYLSEEDLIFVVTQFNRQINEALNQQKTRGGIYAKKISDETTDKLKTKTLLIPNNLDPDIKDETEMSMYYGYPFQLASQEEINSIISEGKAGYAYIHYLWSDHQRMFQAGVIDAATKELLAVFKPGNIEIHSEKCPAAGTSYRSKISFRAKRLKAIY
jgi:hypothetical protein